MGLIAASFYKTAALSWLTGPIFDKELRISSRRKRNYILRVVYLAILLLILSLIWAEEVGVSTNNTVYQVTHLSQVGLLITGIIVLVQFYAAQIITVVMLSTSISDEIYNKTLGVLMSTPVSSLQIVCGKIMSKLLQIILLLCLTLPILGIIRVFGGVPWAFLIQSFCVTLTSVIFAGTLTLNFSIHQKHAFAVIIQTILTGILIYLLFPLFTAWIAFELHNIKENTFFEWITVTNPLFMMQMLVEELFNPRSVPFRTDLWDWNCLFMLACSGLLFFRAVIIVRKKALLLACGQLNLSGGKKKLLSIQKTGKIRRVKGPPVLWKEFHQPIFDMGPVKKIVSFMVFFGCLFFAYYICIKEKQLRYSGSHILFGMIFSILSVFFTAIYSATAITSEKSSRTWPALMSTLVSDWQIIFAKVLGVLRRSCPYWCILFLHMLLFTGTYIHPALWPHLIIIVVPLAFFTASSGILLSMLFKHTTGAVVANLAFIAFLWAGLPVLTAIMYMGGDLAELVITFNPFYHLSTVMDTTCGRNSAYSLGQAMYDHGAISKSLGELRYDWIMGGPMNFIEITIVLQVIGMFYIGAGLFFLWISKTQLREKIF